MRRVIQAKGLVDVVDEKVVPEVFVIIDGEKISALGSQADMPAPDPGLEILDLCDQYILPGLINSHAHLCMPGDGSPRMAPENETDAIWLLTAVRNARTSLMSGVTTVRDCGDRNGLVFQLRRAIEKGLVEGCDIVQSGTFLTMTGGEGRRKEGEVDGVDAVIKGVRSCFKAGSDFIKIMATGSGVPGTYPAHASFSVPELAAAAETAHRIGKTVAAHCRGIPGIRNAIAAGIDHIEHCCFELPGSVLKFEPEIADQIAAAGIYVTPTIQLYRDYVHAWEQKEEKGPLSPEEEKQRDVMVRCVDGKLNSLGGMLAAGVTCVVGNDAGLPLTPFGRLWQEMDAMVAGGMSAMQAMVAATRTAAGAIGRQDQIGTIAPGKQADIIAVDSDPSQDITVLAQPSFVMRAGKIYMQ